MAIECTSEQYFEYYSCKAYYAIVEGNESRAESMLLRAVGEANYFAPDDRRLLETLSFLVHLYYNQGRYAQAEQFMARMIKVSERLDGVNSLQFAENLNLLASIHYHLSQFAQAERAIELSIGICNRYNGNLDSRRIAREAGNLAFFIREEARTSKNKQFLDTALQLVKQTINSYAQPQSQGVFA